MDAPSLQAGVYDVVAEPLYTAPTMLTVGVPDPWPRLSMMYNPEPATNTRGNLQIDGKGSDGETSLEVEC